MLVDDGRIRPAVLAGQFYPAETDVLAKIVDDSLAAAQGYPGQPKAIIAPHAGYIYSGAIAGSAYKAIEAHADAIRRVVLLGPCHRVPVRAFAVPSYESFATPLGQIPVDRETVDALLGHPGVEQRDDAHLPEHCLETQLPFLQRILDDFAIVPVLVGAASRDQTAGLLKTLWGGDETLVVISSDLSHFHDYETAQKLDTAACQAIELLEPESLSEEQACGRYCIRGLLQRAQDLDLRATTLDLRNSGDTAGRSRRDSVVGYAAVAFESAGAARYDNDSRNRLLQTASEAIKSGLREGKPPRVVPERYPWPIRAMRASFVTLKAQGQLRGCVGSARPHQPLVADVASSAYKAAFGDRRFTGLSRREFESLDEGLDVSISILSRPRPVEASSEQEALELLRPNEDGVILRDGERSALFLPQVWDALPEPQEFVSRLKHKAGLPDAHWTPATKLFRFSTESFGTRVQADKARVA